MNVQALSATIDALLAEGKGLLAMDESTATANKRFAPLGIPQTAEAHRVFRDWIVNAPGLGQYISGAILYDETIRQRTDAGATFPEALRRAGIVAGIKVDAGAKAMAGFPGEEVTEGLDGLRERLAEYSALGARFAKWRAVIKIGRVGDGLPTSACIAANVEALARYAALCQEAAIVPIVEPEVLMEGDHSLERCAEVSEEVIRALFERISLHRVSFEHLILKPSMIVPGATRAVQNDLSEVARATVSCFRRAVPAAVPGIAFLSGGQSAELASARLNAMQVEYGDKLPWVVTFSFSRAIQQPALEAWAGKADRVEEAQRILVHRARCNSAARQGKYSADMENG